jgi:hypothetical protein
MTTKTFTLACPHCYSTFCVVLPDDYRRCECGYTDHRDEFERAGARVEPEPLTYEDMTGLTVADLEAWAAEQMESD